MIPTILDVDTPTTPDTHDTDHPRAVGGCWACERRSDLAAHRAAVHEEAANLSRQRREVLARAVVCDEVSAVASKAGALAYRVPGDPCPLRLYAKSHARAEGVWSVKRAKQREADAFRASANNLNRERCELLRDCLEWSDELARERIGTRVRFSWQRVAIQRERWTRKADGARPRALRAIERDAHWWVVRVREALGVTDRTPCVDPEHVRAVRRWWDAIGAIARPAGWVRP